MLTALRLAFKAASSAGLLPAFGWTLVIAVAIAGGTGTWAGMRWERGAAAIKESAQLRAQRVQDAADYHELLTTAKGLQQHDVATSIATRDAADRMGALATDLENTLETHRAFLEHQEGELADLLARRPDLRVLHLGDDVLQHWNRSNAGTDAAGGSAAGAAARPAGEPAAPLPSAPAGAQRPGTGPAGQPRPGHGAVSPVRQPDGQPAARAGRVAGHRLAVVLRRGGRHGALHRGMRAA